MHFGPPGQLDWCLKHQGSADASPITFYTLTLAFSCSFSSVLLTTTMLDHPALDVLQTSPYGTCYTHSTSGCPVSRRDDGSSGCTIELCNMLHAPRYMLCTLCRWMPRISGCRLAGATPVLLSRGCFTHSASGCPISWRDDGSSECTVELCNMLHAPCYTHSAGGCPRFRMMARGVHHQAVQMQHAPSTIHHPLFTWMPHCSVG